MNCGPQRTPSSMDELLDNPSLNRRKLFEKFRKPFQEDFEFIDVRDLLINNLLSEDECRHIQEESDPNKQLERLFFLMTYDEKKSLAQFVNSIQNLYYWLCDEIKAYVTHLRDDDLKEFQKCISWIPKTRNVLVHRRELVSILGN